MSMVHVNISPQIVEAKVNAMWKQILPQITQEILNDANDYIKLDTGIMRDSSELHSRPEEGVIIWQTPYAKRQYWDIETAFTDKNPKATWRWFEVAKEAHMDRWEEQAQRLIDRL